MKTKRSEPRRTTVHRDRSYLDWLTGCQCVACRAMGRDKASQCGITDPAHGPSAATRVKGPDSGAIPLGRKHHIEQHSIGWRDFEKKYGINREIESATHFALYQIDKEHNAA